MKYLRRFFELHTLYSQDDEVIRVADCILMKMLDLSRIPFRIIIKKDSIKIMKADAISYKLYVLFKPEQDSFILKSKILQEKCKNAVKEIIEKSKKRFKVRLDYEIILSQFSPDTYVYSRTFTNNRFNKQVYDKRIIYDEKSDSYKEDEFVNESFYDDEVLEFLYQLDDLNKQLSEQSDESWSYSVDYQFDESKDYILVDFGSSGYSEGFSHEMKIYYKSNMIGPIKVEESESASTVHGSYDNSDIKWYDDYHEIVKEIKSHFGL